MRGGLVKSVMMSALILSGLSMAACSKAEDPAVAEAASENLEVGKAFLAKTEKAEGVKKLPKGLLYKVITPAADPAAAKPVITDTVKVHYEGRLIDGTVFDSSYDRGVPAAMDLQGLVEAWKIAVPEMKKGEVWELYVPSEMAYGEQGAGPIPGNSVLIFKIELIDIKPQ